MDVVLTDLPDSFHDNPYPTYTWLRDNSPVHPQPDGSFIISRHADLDRIYRDTDTFISDKKSVFKPKFGETPLFEHHTTSLVFNDPPLHTRVRKIMVGAMTPRALGSMEPGLIALVDQLLDQMEGASSVDLIEGFAGAIPIEVIGNLFNIPRDERGPLQGWSLAILGALEPALSPAQHDQGNKAVTDFVAYLTDLVADRRKAPGDPETDVLTRLMFSTEGNLTAQELYQNCIFILNAGHETTTNLIGSALWALGKDHAARDAVLASPDVMVTGVDEMLRFESPNQFGNRLTTKDITLNGIDIPAGTDLHLCIGAANRDSAEFDAPEQLNLSRRPNKHLAFAGGAHTCVGLTLARMEGRIAVAKFVQRYPKYRIEHAERGRRVRFRGFKALQATLG
jgi:cytochrome P450